MDFSISQFRKSGSPVAILGTDYSIASRIPPGRFKWEGLCLKMVAHWLGCFDWLDCCVVSVGYSLVQFFIEVTT